MFLNRLRKCFADPGHVDRERAEQAAEADTQPIETPSKRTRRNFKNIYQSGMVIEKNFQGENPKRRGTSAYDRWNLYRYGMTVAEAVAAGVDYKYIDEDCLRGLIKVGYVE